MPGGDGTGPIGRGQRAGKSGRNRVEIPESQDINPDAGAGRGSGRGRGGRGRGKGRN
ncbi:MAG: DUF5320 domain-containing protein [Methanotrichaceae archaeon]